MSEDEFVFCIGYDCSKAIVDRHLLRENKGKSVKELFELGLYRSAFSKALYRNDDTLINYLIEEYNKISNSNYTKKDDFKLLFGVVYPDDINKIKVTYV
ncbi:hypothetical protein BgCN_0677 [Borreliella garinii NMJW1]|uniref:hypothetical protein n=1 Tax=Borreliella TaxID=64895 RepID=UPI000286D6A9|nr:MULTISPECIES: hypothetical protein [Borreliella]AFT83964.1 hypothetical protein BgCN_0677 [Borreliella garinii NMJW1]AHZ73910.1 hypothetical protein X921_00985 [Borreliella garinii SZ]